MSWHRTAGTLLLALVVASCADDAPTGPQLAPLDESAASHWSPQRVDHAVERASLLTEIPIVTEEGEHAFLSITHLDAEETDGAVQLLADGIVSFVNEDGQYVAESFADVPVTLSRTPSAPLAASAGPSTALLPGGATQQRGPDESGVCDVLYLTLGPLNLDLLGLTVDLSNLELDLDAVPGGGRLLGNLLCAVTGLLDPLGALLQILQLLDQINDILDAIDNLLSGLPVVGSALSGDATTALATALGTGKVEDGDFAGTLTITDISWDEAGETLLVDGVLNGKARVGRGITQVRNVVIEDVPATLDDVSSTPVAATAAAGLHMQRSPDENFICDVLFLDLAPTFLDLLGLTVDLDEVELDVDAVPGGGRLLGNLLCAVTGLLDGVGGGGLGGLSGLLDGLLDAIGGLLGGLSL